MKVLFFTYDFPYPTNSGGKNRAYHLLKYARENVEVILFSFYRQIPERESIEEIEKLGISHIRLFARPFPGIGSLISSPERIVQNAPSLLKLSDPRKAITEKLYFKQDIAQELLKTVEEEKIDMVHFESFYTAYYISDLLKKKRIVQLFGTENVEHLLYQDYAARKASKLFYPFYRMESIKIKRDEQKLLQKADITLAVSEEDASVISKITGKDTFIVENGVDLEYFSFKKKKKKKGEKKRLLFIGDFSYFPNVEAITHFYRDVFIQIDDDTVELRIIGKKVSTLPFESDKRVIVDEYVEDIRAEYYMADLFVFPITIGGGTNFKLLEAMACGTPVIAYPDRVQSVGIEPGKEMIVVPNPVEFKEKIKEVLKNETIGGTIALQARAFVEKHFDWKVIGKKLHAIWQEAYTYEKQY